jgi:hypothetical protein
MYLTPTAILANRNGTRLVPHGILYFIYGKVVKDVALVEDVNNLAVDAALTNKVLLRLTAITLREILTITLLTPQTPIVVVVMDVALGVERIPTIEPDSQGFW